MFIHKVLDQPARQCWFIVVECSIYLGGQTVQRRQDPTVDLGPVYRVHISLFKDEPVYIGIERKELIGIIKRAEKFTLYFPDPVKIEFHAFPGGSVGDQVPAGGVGAELAYGLE